MFPGGISWDKNRQHMVEHRRGCHSEIIIALKFVHTYHFGRKFGCGKVPWNGSGTVVSNNKKSESAVIVG